jgi:hypothetical protein
LIHLNADYMGLTSLDLSAATGLEYLYVYNNKLTSLDLSKNTKLKHVYCDNNLLTSINISGLTALEELDVSNNRLTALDVSGLTLLTALNVKGNLFPNKTAILGFDDDITTITFYPQFCHPITEKPSQLSFKVKTEIPQFDGSILLFSKMPVRVQWGIDEFPYDIAFVFPLGTKVALKREGHFIQLRASGEERIANRLFPFFDYSYLTYELTLTSSMGLEAHGIRIISSYRERGLLPVLIDGISEAAMNPGNSIIYEWDLECYMERPTDKAGLAQLLLPSRYIQSDDPDIAALAKSITEGKANSYEKAKAIHTWVAGNIYYNIDCVNGVGDPSAVWMDGEETWSSTYVLRNKRGICGGYANLTAALLRAAGIPAIEITGYILGVDAHGWVEAFADNRWINMDTTWDSGNRFENGKFSPKQTPGTNYFDISAEDLAETHSIMN